MRRPFGSVKLFGEKHWRNFIDERTESMLYEIKQLTNEYILGVDRGVFEKYIEEKYLLEPIQIYCDSESYDVPKKESVSRQAHGRQFSKDVYKFEIIYKYSGSSGLLAVIPTSYSMVGVVVKYDRTKQEIAIPLQLESQSAEEFNKKKEENFNRAINHLPQINRDLHRWNIDYVQKAMASFDHRKSTLLQEHKFFEAISVKIDQSSNITFSVPAISKKTIPKPSSDGRKTFTSVPTVSTEFYNDVLNILYGTGKNIEKKPSLYKGKGEEDLRDQFILLLESRYIASTATGETFNKGGKTDILIKYEDGSNLFIAECKFWRGSVSLTNAIDQLFNRYLTWRDSKVSLLIFVDSKSIVPVLSQVQDTVSQHQYFIADKGKRDESSYTFVMHLPNDRDSYVNMEVMVFHYPKT